MGSVAQAFNLSSWKAGTLGPCGFQVSLVGLQSDLDSHSYPDLS